MSTAQTDCPTDSFSGVVLKTETVVPTFPAGLLTSCCQRSLQLPLWPEGWGALELSPGTFPGRFSAANVFILDELSGAAHLPALSYPLLSPG